MTAQTETAGFPLDWNEWQREWHAWRSKHSADLKGTRDRFPGRNFLANDRLGTWKVNGRLVEMSEVTFPDFGARPRGDDIRGIGLTFGVGVNSEGTVVHTWDELNEVLGL
jgi:hypothetical protein